MRGTRPRHGLATGRCRRPRATGKRARLGGARGRPSGGGRVRIIGGEWRGRRLDVADAPGLRPSGDRLRETLFNWLQPHVVGARCLDLYAGSGALGLEAASRGAAEVVLVERERRVADALERTLRALDAAPRARLVRDSAERFLGRMDGAFDIVFVDPPFDAAGQRSTLLALADAHLAEGARVHVEAPARQPLEETVPEGFEVLRERAFGDVVAAPGPVRLSDGRGRTDSCPDRNGGAVRETVTATSGTPSGRARDRPRCGRAVAWAELFAHTSAPVSGSPACASRPSIPVRSTR